MPKEILTLKEAAALLQVSTRELREAATKGQIPGRRLARQWRFSRYALHIWLTGSALPSAESRLRHAGSLADSPFFREVMEAIDLDRSAQRISSEPELAAA